MAASKGYAWHTTRVCHAANLVWATQQCFVASVVVASVVVLRGAMLKMPRVCEVIYCIFKSYIRPMNSVTDHLCYLWSTPRPLWSLICSMIDLRNKGSLNQQGSWLHQVNQQILILTHLLVCYSSISESVGVMMYRYPPTQFTSAPAVSSCSANLFLQILISLICPSYYTVYSLETNKVTRVWKTQFVKDCQLTWIEMLGFASLKLPV